MVIHTDLWLSIYVKSMNNLKNFSFFLDDVKNITSNPSSSFTKDLTISTEKMVYWLNMEKDCL